MRTLTVIRRTGMFLKHLIGNAEISGKFMTYPFFSNRNICVADRSEAVTQLNLRFP